MKNVGLAGSKPTAANASPRDLRSIIDRNKREGAGDRNRRVGEPLALPRLRRRMIHLKDLQAFGKLRAIRAGVEARPEHDQLADTLRNGPRQGILGETRSDGDEQAQRASTDCSPRRGRPFQVRREDANGERIRKNHTVLEHLVNRAMRSGTHRGAARFCWFHGRKLHAGILAVEGWDRGGNRGSCVSITSIRESIQGDRLNPEVHRRYSESLRSRTTEEGWPVPAGGQAYPLSTPIRAKFAGRSMLGDHGIGQRRL